MYDSETEHNTGRHKMFKVSGIYSNQEITERHAMRGWQCPECLGIKVNRYESRFGDTSEDRFDCQECGSEWGRS